MAFTTVGTPVISQSKMQLAGLFNEMWQITVNLDPASIAAAGIDSATITVPNVNISTNDMVIGVAPATTLSATGEIEYQAWVSAANTLTLRLKNIHATNAADLPASSWKFLIGRPGW